MTGLFFHILRMGAAASVAALAVLAVNLVLRRTGAPKRLLCLLWAVVLFRMVSPAAVSSPVSLFNLEILKNTLTSYSAEAAPEAGAEDTNLAPAGSGEAVSGPYAPEADWEAAGSGAGAPLESENGAAGGLPAAGDERETVLTAVWLFGIGALLLYSAFSCLPLRRRLRFATRIEDNVFETDEIETSFVIGVFRPRVYLTAGLTPERRACILRHERTHIRHGDHILKPLFFLGCCLHWFNPFLWMAYLRFCGDMELACDEAVIREMGMASKETYSRALLECAAHHRFAWDAPLAFGENATESRIKNALKVERPKAWVSAAAAILCVAAAVCLLTDSQEIPQKPGTYRGGLYIVNGLSENGAASVTFGDDVRYDGGWIRGEILIANPLGLESGGEDGTDTEEIMERMSETYPVTWKCGDTERAMISRGASLKTEDGRPVEYGKKISEYLARGARDTEIRIYVSGFEDPLILLLPSEKTLAAQMRPMERVIAKELSLSAEAVGVFSIYSPDGERTIAGFLAKRGGETDMGCALLREEQGKYLVERCYRRKNGALDQDRIVTDTVSAGGALYDVILSNNEDLSAIERDINGGYYGKTEVSGNPSMTVFRSFLLDEIEITYAFYDARGEQIELNGGATLPEGAYAPSGILYQAPFFSVTPEAFLESVRAVEFTVAPDRFEVSAPGAVSAAFGGAVYENPQYLSADVGEEIDGTDGTGAASPDVSAYAERACWLVRASDGTDTGYRVYRMDDEIWIGYWSHAGENGDLSYCERLLRLEPEEDAGNVSDNSSIGSGGNSMPVLIPYGAAPGGSPAGPGENLTAAALPFGAGGADAGGRRFSFARLFDSRQERRPAAAFSLSRSVSRLTASGGDMIPSGRNASA